MNGIGRLKIARNGYIVMAAVFCVLGIFLMANPQKAMEILCILAEFCLSQMGSLRSSDIFPETFIVWHFSLTLALESL